jgi:hypothetical protein
MSSQSRRAPMPASAMAFCRRIPLALGAVDRSWRIAQVRNGKGAQHTRAELWAATQSAQVTYAQPLSPFESGRKGEGGTLAAALREFVIQQRAQTNRLQWFVHDGQARSAHFAKLLGRCVT